MQTKRSGSAPAPQTSSVDEPFGSLRQEVDRVFNEFSRGLRIPDLFLPADVQVLPSMDIHETAQAVTLGIELPGVDEKDIDISAVGDRLTISGAKKSQTERKEGDTYRRERSYGSFSRTLTVPFEIDPASVEAKFAKGVLTVTLPKPPASASKTRKIAIKS